MLCHIVSVYKVAQKPPAVLLVVYYSLLKTSQALFQNPKGMSWNCPCGASPGPPEHLYLAQLLPLPQAVFGHVAEWQAVDLVQDQHVLSSTQSRSHLCCPPLFLINKCHVQTAWVIFKVSGRWVEAESLSVPLLLYCVAPLHTHSQPHLVQGCQKQRRATCDGLHVGVLACPGNARCRSVLVF